MQMNLNWMNMMVSMVCSLFTNFECFHMHNFNNFATRTATSAKNTQPRIHGLVMQQNFSELEPFIQPLLPKAQSQVQETAMMKDTFLTSPINFDEDSEKLLVSFFCSWFSSSPWVSVKPSLLQHVSYPSVGHII